MRVDAHQHFWRYCGGEYPWITADMRILRRDWLPEDLRPLLEAHGFDGCIAVQARASEAETDFLLALAAEHDWIEGVIGWVDLRADDPLQVLERRADSALLAGFRHPVQDEADVAAFLGDPRFRRGVAAMQSKSLVYEVLIHARQLAPVPAFCAACDRHWIVLDHLGKPAIRDSGYEAWRRDVLPLAAMPHVVCKLSGLVTEAANEAGEFDPREIHRYLETALELFGPERLMFGSDWPVCLLAASYAEVVGIVEQWLRGLSIGERDAIRGGTTRRVYGIG